MQRFILLGLMCLVLVSCSEDPVEPPQENRPPTIAFDAPANLAYPRGDTITVLVEATDPDGDDLTVTWRSSAGTITELPRAPQQDPNIYRASWAIPDSLATYALWATVDDGKLASTDSTTYQSGTLWEAIFVTANVTLSAGESPYIVRAIADDDNIIVEARVTLRIEAGVTVYIDKEETTFDIAGKLHVLGTATATVTIRPNGVSPSAGNWEGIKVQPSAGPPEVLLEYATISHARHVLLITQGDATVRVSHCTLVHSLEAAVLLQTGGALEIEECVISNNRGEAISIASLSEGSKPDSVKIINNTIQFNGDFGGKGAIFVSVHDFAGSVPIRVSGNDISLNFIAGVSLGAVAPNLGVFPVFRNNIIEGNELGQVPKIDFRIEPDPTGFDGLPPCVDAANNFWGAGFTDFTAIKGKIFDADDDGRGDELRIKKTVCVTPWLSERP